jgi:hypothetical protein
MYLELTTALIISEDRLTRVVRVVSERKDTVEGYCHHYQTLPKCERKRCIKFSKPHICDRVDEVKGGQSETTYTKFEPRTYL